MVDTEQNTLDELTTKEFIVDKDGFVNVYCDAYSNIVGSRAGLGVWFNCDHVYNCYAPAELPTTTFDAKIQAATLAFEQSAKAGLHKLNIHTDSLYIIKCFLNNWIRSWKKRNWVKVNGTPVKHKKNLQKLEQSSLKFDAVKWVHTQGIVGGRGVIEADALARKGALYCKPYEGKTFVDINNERKAA